MAIKIFDSGDKKIFFDSTKCGCGIGSGRYN